jgi:hypothetical protein
MISLATIAGLSFNILIFEPSRFAVPAQSDILMAKVPFGQILKPEERQCGIEPSSCLSLVHQILMYGLGGVPPCAHGQDHRS